MANKRLTPEQKAGIVRLRFEEGMTVTAIAAKYGICKTTAFNVISEYKKHGYTLPESEPETAYATDEETERAVDDEPCYEVTGDTDIDAYMADRSKKSLLRQQPKQAQKRFMTLKILYRKARKMSSVKYCPRRS